MEKRFASPIVFKDGTGDEGLIEAVVSTFGVLDADREVVVASAFTDGQAVPMVWSHKWDQVIGRGTIRVDTDRAVFSGRVFLDTTAGLDAFRTMKNMAELQQFSWGFTVLKSDVLTIAGEQVRRILETETHEVSPVLVGSNPQTGILAIKGHGLPFDEHAEAVRVALAELLERIRSGSDARGKEGRPISEARRGRMATVRDQIRTGADEIDALLTETAPLPKGLELSSLYGEFLRTQARLNGVAVGGG